MDIKNLLDLELQELSSKWDLKSTDTEEDIDIKLKQKTHFHILFLRKMGYVCLTQEDWDSRWRRVKIEGSIFIAMGGIGGFVIGFITGMIN